jgi:hypothetical protein
MIDFPGMSDWDCPGCAVPHQVGGESGRMAGSCAICILTNIRARPIFALRFGDGGTWLGMYMDKENAHLPEGRHDVVDRGSFLGGCSKCSANDGLMRFRRNDLRVDTGYFRRPTSFKLHPNTSASCHPKCGTLRTSFDLNMSQCWPHNSIFFASYLPRWPTL